MSQQNRNAPFLALSPTNVHIKDHSKRSSISYTRKFVLSLAKVVHRLVKLPMDHIQLPKNCEFEDSTGFLPSPYTESDMPQDSPLKALDNVDQKSSEPYAPQYHNKALPSTGDSNGSLSLTGDSNGSLSLTGDGNGSLPSTGDSNGLLSATGDSNGLQSSIGDSNGLLNSDISVKSDSLEYCSCLNHDLYFPDEESLTRFDRPFWNPELESPPYSESELDSLDSTFDMIKSLLEFVLDGNDDDYDDDYYAATKTAAAAAGNATAARNATAATAVASNATAATSVVNNNAADDDQYDEDYSLLGAIMEELVQHMIRLGHLYIFYLQYYSGRNHNCFLRERSTEPGVFSLFSDPSPYLSVFNNDELRMFDHGAGESRFQQLPAPEVPSCKDNKPSPMQKCFEFQVPSDEDSVKKVHDSHGGGAGDGEAGQASFYP